MNIYFKILAIAMSVAGTLFVFSAFLYYLKQLKKNHIPAWKFLDYISVGHLEHLVNKHIKGV